MARVRSVPQAAKWIDRVGLALVFPKADLVLPSLWEQVNGSPTRADGWTAEMSLLWQTKDDLPERGLACVGKHLAGVATCIAPRLLPALLATRDVGDLEGVEAAITAAVGEAGPLTMPQLRDLVGASKREIDSAVARLQRKLVLTNDRRVEQDRGWAAIAVELLERKWSVAKRLPPADQARRELAATVLETAGELTAADLGAALGWRRKQAEAVLEEIAGSRNAGGFRIWARP